MIHYADLPHTACLPQAALRSGVTLEELERLYAVSATRHPDYANLVQLKYNQIESDFSIPLVRQCRGIILDEADEWAVIAWPFDKFFNHGESLAAPIDWHSAAVQEKLDGSLLIMYWYDGGWHVATSGMPSASGTVHGSDISFEDLFWRIWEKKSFPLPSAIQRGYTFLFELTSPLNRVVCKQPEADLHLTGMRSVFSGVEHPVRYRPTLNPVREFRLDTLDHVLISFDRMDPLQQEGYVIVDRNFRRIKVKHPGYVALHHMRSGFSARRALEIVRKGEIAEVIANFPEWTVPLGKIQAAYDGLVAVLEQTWSLIKDIEPRKAYAAEALKSIYPPVLFQLKDKYHTSVRQALLDIHIDSLMDVLGVRGIVIEGAI